jgi:outer membrane protein
MSRSLRHAAMVLWIVASLVVSPVFAQAQQSQAQSQGQTQSQPQDQEPAPPPAPITAKKLNLGPDYAKGKPFFPNIFAPYTPIKVGPPELTNTPRLNQLIQDGKLMLSLDDAIALALENNLDIRVQRYLPWFGEVSLLRTESGGVLEGVSNAPLLLGSGPSAGFDPIVQAQIGWESSANPLVNPFTSGTGTTTLSRLVTNTGFYDLSYSQGFHQGASLQVSFSNSRISSESPGNIFNPFVQSTLTVTVSQPLLKGFGFLANTRYIIEAKNTLKANEQQFKLAVINDISQVEDDYWLLVYDRDFVKVEEAAVTVSQKLYGDSKKQLEIGTMAPLEVLTAESELASDQQALVQAQTAKLQQETKLLNDITKNPLDPSLNGVEIVPTQPLSTPDVVENIAIQDAVKEALQKRPDIKQFEYVLKNDDIEVRATKNSLLPSLTAFGQYSTTGVGGNATVNTSTTPTGYISDPTAPLVDASGNLLTVGNPSPPGVLAYVGSPVYPTAIKAGGLGNALSSVFANDFPTYEGGLTLTLPVRNRSAQADNAQATLAARQAKIQYQELENQVFVNVRNALIALTQYRAQVVATEKAKDLAQRTLDSEQKKYQLGSSTSYQVVLRSRDLTTAQANLLLAKINLLVAEVAFDQSMGRTLEVNRIEMADAMRGKVLGVPNIPGALDADEPPLRSNPWAPGKK